MKPVRLIIIIALLAAAGLFAYEINSRVPTGSISGSIIAQDTGIPIKADITITGAKNKYFYLKSDSNGIFIRKNIPIGEYKLSGSSSGHKFNDVSVSVAEGKTTSLRIEAEAKYPSIETYIHQHIFSPNETPGFTCHGTSDSNEIIVKAYKLNLENYFVNGSRSLSNLVGIESYYDSKENISKYKSDKLDNNPNAQLIANINNNINTRDNEGIFTQRINLPKLSYGLYVLSVSSGKAQSYGWILVTTIGMVTKTAPGQITAFAMDLKSGKPLNDCEVSVYANQKKVTQIQTDANGLAVIKTGALKINGQIAIIAESKGAIAFVTPWGSDIDRQSSNYLIYSYTERPIYRPGQIVYFKGIARRITDSGYQNMAGKEIQIEVRDPNNTLIYKATKKTNQFGSYDGSFKLDDFAPINYYSINSNISGEEKRETTSFQVSAYRKPEYTVKVDTSKKRYIRGEMVKARISAQYYFGSPVANAKVHYYIERTPFYYFDNYEGYEFGNYEDYGGYGETVDQGDVTTNAKGEAIVEFQAQWPNQQETDGYETDQQFNILIDVTDQSDRAVSSSSKIIATRGRFALNIEPSSWVATPGQNIVLKASANYYNHKVVRRLKLKVSAIKETWKDNELKKTILKEMQFVTDNSGEAKFDFKYSGAGAVAFIVEARDMLGNKISKRTDVYYYMDAYQDESGSQISDIKITTDKKIYNPGDIVKVLVSSPITDCSALVTVEGEKIFQSRVIELKSQVTMFTIRVDKIWKTNFYISVGVVKNKAFRTATIPVKISLKPQQLDITIKSIKNIYEPGEIATYNLKALTKDGKPAKAELSMGVVDEAIYDILQDTTTPILNYFYFEKPNMVQTGFSFPEIYLSEPDKSGGFKSAVRRKFEDTAFWEPSIVTNKNGDASVSFKLPDNLTKWRATVRAITTDTLCGQAQSKITTQKNLMVRIIAPRFLVESDKTDISAVIHNNLAEKQQVQINLKTNGLKIDGNKTQTITIPAKGIRNLNWQAEPDSSGKCKIMVSAAGSKNNDAVELSIPVLPFAVKHDSVLGGVITGTANKELLLQSRNTAIPKYNKIVVKLSPSLISSVFGSLDYLTQYPWGCIEQTTSSFLPDIAVFEMLKSKGISNPRLEEELPKMVRVGLAKIYGFRHEDGGWSWSEYGQSDAWITSYVCYALLMAKESGFEINKDILDDGLRLLNSKWSIMKVDDKAFGAYVLALGGYDVSKAFNQYTNNYNSVQSLAYYALAAQKSNRKEIANKLINELLSRSNDSDTLSWDYSDNYGNSNTFTTALALKAILAVNPTYERSGDIVRWLAMKRLGNSWYSTRDTAMAVIAISDYLKITGELNPDLNVKITLGSITKTIQFSSADIFMPEKQIIIPSSEIKPGRNILTIQTSGIGNLYYSAKLSAYEKVNGMPATFNSSGIRINRSYYQIKSQSRLLSWQDAEESSVSQCDINQTLMVKLSINSTRAINYILVEDYIPAGFEIVDKGYIEAWEWTNWWNSKDFYDDRAVFYINTLKKGKSTIKYFIRAASPGTYHALPCTIFAMYQPQIRSATAENIIKIID